jgi:hypothetical protein
MQLKSRVSCHSYFPLVAACALYAEYAGLVMCYALALASGCIDTTLASRLPCIDTTPSVTICLCDCGVGEPY